MVSVVNSDYKEMISDMVRDRGGSVCAMDHIYCIDNGAMIVQAGIFALQYGVSTKLEDSWCTRRFRTDQVSVVLFGGQPTQQRIHKNLNE